MQFHTFFGINFIKSTYEECLRTLEIRLAEGQKTLVVTPNPEMLYAAFNDTKLLEILQSAQIALPDGVGIFVGYQIVDSRLPKWIRYLIFPYWCLRAILQTGYFQRQYGTRITGSRLTPDILSYAAKNNIGVSIIDPVVTGDNPGDIAKKHSQKTMKHLLEKKYPRLICDVIIGESSEKRNYWPIVLTTHGAGKQEKIIARILAENPAVLLGIGIGGSIDLLTGFRAPAPALLRHFGAEWLYRLSRNPKKHSQRMKNVLRFLTRCFNEF